MMIETIEELRIKYPQFPEDMMVFTKFIRTYKNQLLLLREKARVTNNHRLYEAVQNLFEDYFQYTHDKALFNHFTLEVDGYYDDYLLSSMIGAAIKVRDHYAIMWNDSRNIPVDHNGLHYTAGNYRWGDACSGCNRLAEDLKTIRRGKM